MSDHDRVSGYFENGHFVPTNTFTQDPNQQWDQNVSTEKTTTLGIPASAGGHRKETSSIKDTHWVRRAFLNFRKTPYDVARGRASPANRAFTDTTLGGDFAINPAYQSTRFADLKARQITEVGMGIGRFYYEQIWQNRHDIHIRFGFQTFTSGFTFFSRWYDYTADRLSRTGRGPSWLFSLSKVAGWYIAWTMPAYLITANLIKFALAYGGQSRYCYLKTGMTHYWAAVNNLVNAVAANMAVTLPVSERQQIESANAAKQAQDAKTSSAATSERATWMKTYMETLPSIYQDSMDGGFQIDMMKVATRAQRLHNMAQKHLLNRIDANFESQPNAKQATKWLLDRADNEFLTIVNEAGHLSKPHKRLSAGGNEWSFTNMLTYAWEAVSGFKTDSDNNAHSTDLNESEGDSKKASTDLEAEESINSFYGKKNGDVDESLKALWNAQQDNGADWISFRVSATKSVSESFSNSATESEIAGVFNNFAKARQKINFNFAGGSMFGDAIKGIVNGAMDMVAGALNGVGLGGLNGVLMGASIDIPKQWESSSVSLPRLSYDVQLRTPYAHPLAVFQACIVPTLCLVAGTAPISRGRNAFGTPFYCEVYDKGAWQVKMGCIGSLSITRGVGNVPWSRERLPLGIDISFEILDMSTVMSVPITARQGVTDLIDAVATPGALADELSVGSDTPLDDYLFALSGLGLTEQIYNTNRMNRNWGKWLRNVQSSFSMDYLMSGIVNHTPAAVFQLFHQGTARR